MTQLRTFGESDWRQRCTFFVANDDWDLRRRILPWLRFDAQHYPDELHPMVEDAIRICRAHPDAYIRHRVEHQF